MGKSNVSAGELISEARRRRGMQQKTAAEKSGLSYSWYRALEQGIHYRGGKEIEARPTAEAIVRIADALDTDPNPILAAAGFPHLRRTPDIRGDIDRLLDLLTTAEVFSVHGFIEGLIASRPTEDT